MKRSECALRISCPDFEVPLSIIHMHIGAFTSHLKVFLQFFTYNFFFTCCGAFHWEQLHVSVKSHDNGGFKLIRIYSRNNIFHRTRCIKPPSSTDTPDLTPLSFVHRPYQNCSRLRNRVPGRRGENWGNLNTWSYQDWKIKKHLYKFHTLSWGIIKSGYNCFSAELILG